MIIVNIVGVSLFTFYSLFYLLLSNPRVDLAKIVGSNLSFFQFSFAAQLSVSFTIILSMLFHVHRQGLDAADLLGFCCMSFNIINFASPLAGMVSYLGYTV